MQRKPSLVRYIEQRRKDGKSESEIRDELLNAGWQMDIIMSAMHTNMYTHLDNQVVPQTKGKLRRSTAAIRKHAKRASKKISETRQKKSRVKKAA
jgi:hypothetical protein